MQQHALKIKTNRSQRSNRDPLASWSDPPTRAFTRAYPPYPEPPRLPAARVPEFDKIRRDMRGE